MTDSRVSREHLEALTGLDPSSRVSREHLEALTGLDPDSRVSQLHVSALTGLDPDTRVASLHLEVLTSWMGSHIGFAHETDTAIDMHIGISLEPAIEVDSGWEMTSYVEPPLVEAVEIAWTYLEPPFFGHGGQDVYTALEPESIFGHGGQDIITHLPPA